MPRYELAFTPDIPATPLADYDPKAVEIVDEAFTAYEQQVEKVGPRRATWGERQEVITATGMYFARILNRDTIMFDRESNENLSHSRQFVISNQVALGNVLYTGGTHPGVDYEDQGHNNDPVAAFETLMPDGGRAPVSVRIGLRRAAIPDLFVISDLSSIGPDYRFFDPTFYKDATPEPIDWRRPPITYRP